MKNSSCLCILYIINNPPSYLTCSILCSAIYLYLRCSHIGIKGCINGFTDKGTFLI